MKKIYAVVPAFNEEKNIPSLIQELRNVEIPEYKLEFVVVDDGSRDLTKLKVKELGANLISLPYNMGIGMSVQTGFCYAVAQDADFVVQVDGDGQHIPSEIVKLVKKFQSTPKLDVVIGTRFSEGQKDGIRSTTFLRWLAGRLLAWTVNLLTDKHLTDTTSGFRMFRRRAAEFIAHRYPDDYPEVQILVLLARNGFNLEEVSVEMRARKHGESSINWSRSIYYVIKVIFASFMDRFRK